MSMRLGILGCWLAGVGVALAILARAHFVADLSGFLPPHPTPMQRLLIEELRDGPGARSIMVALVGGTPAVRAELSRAMAARLERDARFSSVANGAPFAEADERFVFEHRYALSPAVDAARFSVAGLHGALADTVEALASAEGPWLESLVPHDPTGETLAIIDALAQRHAPRMSEGVLVSSDGRRALLLAQMAAPGADLDAAAAALAALRSAFEEARRTAGARAAEVRLLASGPPVFAVGSRTEIERAALRLSLLGAVLVLGVLGAVYRSWRALALGLAPVATGALAGLALVALAFGAVQGTTLGFGSTLIGESVDYSIYFFIGARTLSAGAWRSELWPTVRLGMLVSVCGFAALLASGFPGLAQLGVYSIGGLLAAAAVTRFVLPQLAPARLAVRDLTPLGARCSRALVRVARARRSLRAAALLLALLALAALAHAGQGLWSGELETLSPIPASLKRLDAELRADLGVADVPDLVTVVGPDLESVLEGAERAAAALAPLLAAGAIGGVDDPAAFLPSRATQAMRRAALPEPETLRGRLRAAAVGLPLDPERLAPFVADVAAERGAPELTAESLKGTSLEAGLRALVQRSTDHWTALLPLHASDPASPSIDAERVRRALAPLDSGATAGRIRLLDLKAESDALYRSYFARARAAALMGLAAIGVLIALVRRSLARAVRVLVPLLLAVLTVAGALALGARELTLMHLVGLLLIVAVGSNYALFFDAGRAATSLPPRTLASLLVANMSTVLGFGLLMLSRVPILTALGVTVAPGALLALVFSALLIAGARPGDGAAHA